MKHLEMSQQNLNEWVRKASLADSVLVTTFLPGFITETIQKTRDQPSYPSYNLSDYQKGSKYKASMLKKSMKFGHDCLKE